MGLLDEIKADSRGRERPSAVGRALDGLPDEERAELVEALANPHEYTHAAIARVLKRRGFDGVTEGNVGTYRAKMRDQRQ